MRKGFWNVLVLFVMSSFAWSTPKALGAALTTIGSFCSTFPQQCQRGTISILGAKGTDNVTYMVEVDQTTGAVPTSLTITSEGTTGSAVPAKALQVGGTDGTNLRALSVTSTGVVNVFNTGRPVTSSIVASNAYASTNVTTLAYVQLIASTANAINNLCISNSSGSIIKVGTGAAAAEVARIYLPAGGAGCYAGLNIPAATRISLEALDADASSGYFLLTGY